MAHWNIDILDSKSIVFKFVDSFTWTSKKTSVFFWNKTYQTGEKLTAKTMEEIEKTMDRLNGNIGKWFINIYPSKIKNKLTFC